MDRLWIVFGALVGFLAVAMAAGAAHALIDPAALEAVRNTVQMQGWHALALVLTGIWATRGGWLAHCAGPAFAVGIALFCAGVYLHVFGGFRLPMIAPTGGTLLMAGWLLLGASAIRAR